jgi:hypothetical protein
MKKWMWLNLGYCFYESDVFLQWLCFINDTHFCGVDLKLTLLDHEASVLIRLAITFGV